MFAGNLIAANGMSIPFDGSGLAVAVRRVLPSPRGGSCHRRADARRHEADEALAKARAAGRGL